jgi:hypothetical protein
MKKGIWLVLAVFLLGCSKDESTKTDRVAMELVTGINLRENIEDTPMVLGNPNIFIENKFVMYPNPAMQAVNFLTEQNAQEIWFVPAFAEKIHQDVNFNTILSSSLYSEASIATNSVFSVNGLTSNQLVLNIESLEPGFYRVFAKIDGQIYWDNLYKPTGDPEVDELEMLVNFWN